MEQCEIEEWMNKCVLLGVYEAGSNGDEYVELSDNHKWKGKNISFRER